MDAARPRSVRLSRAVWQAMAEHARRAMPNECCGLLIGAADRVDRAMAARNLRESPTRYLLDPVDHFAAMKAARADGLAVVGVYHSHPHSPPVPSARDLDEATYPDYLYVIVTPGVGDDLADARGYWISHGRYEPVDLQIA